MNLETIKEKVGPLPIWAWGVIAGVIMLGGYYLFQRNKTLKSDAGTVTPDTYSGADAGLGFAVPVGNVSSVIGESVETNQSWIAKSVRYLSEQGYSSADAQVWLQQYVSGIPIVGTRAKPAIQEALDRFGTAPDTSSGVPTFLPDPQEASTPQRYVRRSDGEISAVYSDGTKRPLGYAEWEQAATAGATWLGVSEAEYNAIPTKAVTA